MRDVEEGSLEGRPMRSVSGSFEARKGPSDRGYAVGKWK